MARKISAVFSKSSDKPRSLKSSSAAVISETVTSAHQWKDSAEYAKGRHVDGEGVTT